MFKKAFFSLIVMQSAFAAPIAIESIQKNVEECICRSETIPGLQAAEFALLKESLVSTMKQLVKEEAIEIEGRDQDVRPTFVALQGIIEHVLASKLGTEVTSLSGMILTPMPATPLCSKGEISKELLDPSIEKDPLRELTVKARTVLLREYLAKGGNLKVAYPEKGFGKRTEEQQAIYREELKKHPLSLVDAPLLCDSLPDDVIGAIYRFTDQTGNAFVFAIRMTQANDPRDAGHFGLWLGAIDSPKIQKRTDRVFSFLNTIAPAP